MITANNWLHRLLESQIDMLLASTCFLQAQALGQGPMGDGFVLHHGLKSGAQKWSARRKRLLSCVAGKIAAQRASPQATIAHTKRGPCSPCSHQVGLRLHASMQTACWLCGARWKRPCLAAHNPTHHWETNNPVFLGLMLMLERPAKHTPKTLHGPTSRSDMLALAAPEPPPAQHLPKKRLGRPAHAIPLGCLAPASASGAFCGTASPRGVMQYALKEKGAPCAGCGCLCPSMLSVRGC